MPANQTVNLIEKPATAAHTPAPPSLREALPVWAKIGVLSFGGPAGQIAMMHRVLVEEKRWLDERAYMLALNFCTLLPGPEAMQLATYAGWRMHGVAGGLVAGLLFVVPGALIMLALAFLYLHYGAVAEVAAVFTGIKAAVMAIVIEALLRISKRSLTSPFAVAVAISAFVAIFIFKVPFPLIVLAAGVLGYLRGNEGVTAHQSSAPGVTDATAVAAELAGAAPVNWRRSLATLVTWLLIWAVPLIAVAAAFGAQSVFAKLAVFFSTLAVVTFGGAYAVLAYMAQEAVQTHGWLQAGEMLDGLGLAETTPGPLILVTEFVGVVAAARAPSGLGSLSAGLLGAVVTLWATFAPCFLYVFVGAPYIERLQAQPRLRAALSAITAAVVGIIFNLSVWFALHVLFARVVTLHWGVMNVAVPELGSMDVRALALAVIAAFLLLRVKLGVASVLAIAALLALGLSHMA